MLVPYPEPSITKDLAYKWHCTVTYHHCFHLEQLQLVRTLTAQIPTQYLKEPTLIWLLLFWWRGRTLPPLLSNQELFPGNLTLPWPLKTTSQLEKNFLQPTPTYLFHPHFHCQLLHYLLPLSYHPTPTHLSPLPCCLPLLNLPSSNSANPRPSMAPMKLPSHGCTPSNSTSLLTRNPITPMQKKLPSPSYTWLKDLPWPGLTPSEKTQLLVPLWPLEPEKTFKHQDTARNAISWLSTQHMTKKNGKFSPSLESYILTFQSNTTHTSITDHNILISFFTAGILTYEVNHVFQHSLR